MAKAEDFVALADESPRSVAAKGEDATGELNDDIDRLRTTLKENISVGRVRRLVAAPGQVIDTYVHRQAGRGVNAVAVVIEGGSDDLAHDIAVHIAVHQAGLPEPRRGARGRCRRRTRHGGRDLANEGKPEAAMEKIVEGRMTGWFKERVLLDQAYVKRREADDRRHARLGPHRVVRAGRHRRLT